MSDLIFQLVYHTGCVLLGVLGLFLLFSPVIFILVAIIMIACGKSYILDSWLHKIGVSNLKYSNQNTFSAAMLHEKHNGFERMESSIIHHTSGFVDGHSSIVSSNSSNNLDYSRSINSASGLPMIGSSAVDSGGNIFGTRRL